VSFEYVFFAAFAAVVLFFALAILSQRQSYWRTSRRLHRKRVRRNITGWRGASFAEAQGLRDEVA